MSEKINKTTTHHYYEKAFLVMDTYYFLKELTKTQKDIEVRFVLNKPCKGMGSVSVIGKNLNFFDNKTFCKLAMMANNTDVYPKTNGTIQLDFTYYGLNK